MLHPGRWNPGVWAFGTLWLGIWAGSSPGGAAEDAIANSPVAARVGGDSILVADVDAEIQQAARRRNIEVPDNSLLRARTLQHLIDRKLVSAYLAGQKMAATDQEIDLAVEGISKRLQQRETSLDDHLKNNGMNRAQYRQAIGWQIGWQRYLDKFLTDENLQRFFKEHQRDFDGTEMRVAHILFQVPGNADAQATDAVKAQATQVRQEILDGKTTFDAAARQHSIAPTGKMGGDMGLIQRHEPMPEAFSQAAFALEKGDVSAPVVTTFGVHLIQCLEIKPGQRPWTEARKELRAAVSEYLFRWIVDRQQPVTRVEFTGTSPHLDPQSKSLVE